MGTTSLGLGREGPTGGDPGYRLEIGSVMRRTFATWAANLVPFTLVGLVAYLPAFALIGFLGSQNAMSPLWERLVDVLTNFMTILLTGAVTYGVFRQLHGERTEVGEILRVGVSSFGAVWVTGILFGLAVLVGICALIIPGIVLMVRFWVAVPVAVIESPGASASLSRSAELTEGNRWRVLGVALLMGVVLILGVIVLGIAAALASGALTSEAAEAPDAPTPPLLQALILLLMTPIQVLISIAPVIVYHDLRVGKEGVDVEELLKVFA